MSSESDAAGNQPAPGAVRLALDEGGTVLVEAGGFSGNLAGLVAAVQRGDVDITQLRVGGLTSAFRRELEARGQQPELRTIADFLTLAARLVSLKAAAIAPDRALPQEEGSADDEVGESPGQRLAEYRRYKAAADALLADPAEEGVRSFLGMAAPDIRAVERLHIPPERLAAAFRAVLERIAEVEPVPLGMATFSVADMMARLQATLAGGHTIRFEDLFVDIRSRLEAVACFLALLELVNRGRATVSQAEAFAPIMVSACADDGADDADDSAAHPRDGVPGASDGATRGG